MHITVLKPTLHDLLYLANNTLPYEIVCERSDKTSYCIFDTPYYSINLSVYLERIGSNIKSINKFLQKCAQKHHKYHLNRTYTFEFNDVEEEHLGCLVSYMAKHGGIDHTYHRKEEVFLESMQENFYSMFACDDFITLTIKPKDIRPIPSLDENSDITFSIEEFEKYIKKSGIDAVRPIMERFDCGVERIKAMVERTFPKHTMIKAIKYT